jgi:hypothetical protein
VHRRGVVPTAVPVMFAVFVVVWPAVVISTVTPHELEPLDLAHVQANQRLPTVGKSPANQRLPTVGKSPANPVIGSSGVPGSQDFCGARDMGIARAGDPQDLTSLTALYSFT